VHFEGAYHGVEWAGGGRDSCWTLGLMILHRQREGKYRDKEIVTILKDRE